MVALSSLKPQHTVHFLHVKHCNRIVFLNALFCPGKSLFKEKYGPNLQLTQAALTAYRGPVPVVL